LLDDRGEIGKFDPAIDADTLSSEEVCRVDKWLSDFNEPQFYGNLLLFLFEYFSITILICKKNYCWE